MSTSYNVIKARKYDVRSQITEILRKKNKKNAVIFEENIMNNILRGLKEFTRKASQCYFKTKSLEQSSKFVVLKTI